MINEEAALIRDKIIEREFSRMNDMQFRAVTNAKGPMLILAGAGSGKTTVLVNRIAYLISYGEAYGSSDFSCSIDNNKLNLIKDYYEGNLSVDCDVKKFLSLNAPKPWEILAITFTNKAANELKERLIDILGGTDGESVWASTFHSCCVKILRRECERLGYSKHFTIYDDDDQNRVIKECKRILGFNDGYLSVKTIKNEISRAKDMLISPKEYMEEHEDDPKMYDIGRAYKKYRDLLKNADAMDFDDLIVNTVEILCEYKDVREYYQSKFKYVMVDEYQDTNHAQYKLTSLLAGGYNNLCVVGDDDQSIYRFRGATIENILQFEFQYKDALTIRLEQNYRSTGNILDAANAVIANNSERKGKSLWTNNKRGDKVLLNTLPDDLTEGEFIANYIIDNSDKRKWSDFAVLYRMNAQSSAIERAFVRSAVPYRIIGGHRFYERKEIKDIMAYLSVIVNPHDNVRLRRIINTPKRGIGDVAVNNAAAIADGLGVSIYEVVKNAREYPSISRAAKKLDAFVSIIEDLRDKIDVLPPNDFFELLLKNTGYIDYLSEDEETLADRVANLGELQSNIMRYINENPETPTIEAFLLDASLMTDIDNYNRDADAVVMMTLHSAKGLEFPVVFIPGMENNVFPGSLLQTLSDLEEERRLMYVGITRAKEKIILTNAKARMTRGVKSYNKPSCFLSEIPPELTETVKHSEIFSNNGYESEFNEYSINESKRKIYSQPNIIKMSDKKTPDYKPGDLVEHKKFGKGLVLSVERMASDILLEIKFSNCGTKKLMAKIAPMKKL